MLPIILLAVGLVCSSCGASAGRIGMDGNDERPTTTGTPEDFRLLRELAQQERTDGFSPGRALAESGIRERIGDYAGATIAAFKELFYAYALGIASADEVRLRLRSLSDSISGAASHDVRSAVECALAFFDERWLVGRDALRELFPRIEHEEPDSFPRWMLLVCALELNENRETTIDAYRSIQARYSNFPTYWYRSARWEFEEGWVESSSTVDAAERAVSLAPDGPYADSAREILASAVGLPGSTGKYLRTKHEIETASRAAVENGDPAPLEFLLPVLSLADNPYTLYALGAFRGMASDPKMAAWLRERGERAAGRVRDRLRYAVGFQ